MCAACLPVISAAGEVQDDACALDYHLCLEEDLVNLSSRGYDFGFLGREVVDPSS